jgi:hypothetical protein
MRLFASTRILPNLRAGVSFSPQELGPVNRIGLWFGRHRLAAAQLQAPGRWIVQGILLTLAAFVWLGIIIACIAIFAAYMAGFRRR